MIYMHYQKYKVGGFTLIELLVVIAVLSILSTIILSNVSSAREKSRLARARANSKQVDNVLALQGWNNLAGIWHTNTVNAPDGEAITDPYIDSTGEFIIQPYHTGITQWSTDTPMDQGASLETSISGFVKTLTGDTTYNGTDGFTMASWFKMEDQVFWSGYAWSETPRLPRFEYNTTGEYFRIYAQSVSNPTSNNGYFYTFDTKLDRHKWYHIVFTIKAGQMALYVDGVLIEEHFNPDIDDQVFLNNFEWQFFTSNPSSTLKIYNLRIWHDYFSPHE
jgi:prepilin-type N-terminal cleavage/methylation domain-containing protein